MKYICRYKTDVKCDMVRFDTLVKFGKFPHLVTKLLPNNADRREEGGKLKNK